VQHLDLYRETYFNFRANKKHKDVFELYICLLVMTDIRMNIMMEKVE